MAAGPIGPPNPRTHGGSLERLRNQVALAWPLPHLPRRRVPTARSAVSGTQVQPLRTPSEAGPLEGKGLLPQGRKSKLLQIMPGCAGASDALGVPLTQVRAMSWPLWAGTPVTTGWPENKASERPGSGSPPALLRGRCTRGIRGDLLAMGAPGVPWSPLGSASHGCQFGSPGVFQSRL